MGPHGVPADAEPRGDLPVDPPFRQPREDQRLARGPHVPRVPEDGFRTRPLQLRRRDHQDANHAARAPPRLAASTSRTNASTTCVGTAMPSPPTIIALMPTPRPWASASGPPELPG